MHGGVTTTGCCEGACQVQTCLLPAPPAGFLLRVVCNERLREELTAVHDAMVDALQVGGPGWVGGGSRDLV